MIIKMCSGSQDGTRTRKPYWASDFKSDAYTNSATRPWSSRVESNHRLTLYKNATLTPELLEDKVQKKSREVRSVSRRCLGLLPTL
jgi:hypothetical protein